MTKEEIIDLWAQACKSEKSVKLIETINYSDKDAINGLILFVKATKDDTSYYYGRRGFRINDFIFVLNSYPNNYYLNLYHIDNDTYSSVFFEINSEDFHKCNNLWQDKEDPKKIELELIKSFL
jgi:hypothetical protein